MSRESHAQNGEHGRPLPAAVLSLPATTLAGDGPLAGTSFFDTFACRSGDHCRTCRDRTDGHAFRANIAARFSLPTIDWPCPHSRPWGFEGNAAPFPVRPPPTRRHPPVITSTGVTAEAKRRFAICQACEHSRNNAFACALHLGCCFGKHRSKPSARCPDRRW